MTMGLFGPTLKEIETPIDLETGHFYNLSPIHILPTSPIPILSKLELHPWNTQCMFSIYELRLDKVKVGLAFTSPFTVKNCGGYLITHMTKNAGKATEYKVLVRTEDIVIYSFPNYGALAISPKVSEYVRSFIEEQ